MVFEIVDVTGRLIRLNRAQYAHIMEHSNMANTIEHIKEALQKPTIVKTSANDAQVRYCYRFHKQIKMFLMVVVKYLNGHGFVITAYFTRKP